MSSDPWDRIQIDGSGTEKAIRGRLIRNGQPVPGLIDFTIQAGADGGPARLTTVQYVILEPLVTVEEATQALEEREAAWQQEPRTCGCGHPPHPGLVCGYPVLKEGLRRNCDCEG